eukprot:6906688-Prymnesium_polylepis.1
MRGHALSPLTQTPACGCAQVETEAFTGGNHGIPPPTASILQCRAATGACAHVDRHRQSSSSYGPYACYASPRSDGTKEHPYR